VAAPAGREGVTRVFKNADLSGITDREIWIRSSAQRALIEVNEEGPVAIALTDWLAVGDASPYTPVEFGTDRPFLYMITHAPTGGIMFMGRVISPG